MYIYVFIFRRSETWLRQNGSNRNEIFNLLSIYITLDWLNSVHLALLKLTWVGKTPWFWPDFKNASLYMLLLNFICRLESSNHIGLPFLSFPSWKCLVYLFSYCSVSFKIIASVYYGIKNLCLVYSWISSKSPDNEPTKTTHR